MPPNWDLLDLGHALVILLVLVGGVDDRPRDGVVPLAGDEQQRPAVGFLVSTLASVQGFRLAVAAWNSDLPEAGTAKSAYSSLASSSLTALAKP